MKNMYLVRHGETLFNQRDIVQGVVNSPLVLEGVAQALHTRKEYFEKKQIQYDHVFTSPEGRCIQTTQLLTDQPYTAVRNLYEMCFGKLEGAPVYLCPPADQFDTYYGTIGGETTAQVQTRYNKALFKIMDDPANQNVLVVAHGSANYAFATFWKKDWQVQKLDTLNNCSVLHFLYDPQAKKFILKEVFNEDFHTDRLQEAIAMHQALIV